MTRSMTGYARAKSKEIDGTSWVVELHSVNRKMLDIHTNLPRELFSFDIPIRKTVASHLHRGKVSVMIHATKTKKVSSSLPELKSLKREFAKLCKELKLDAEEITLPFLLQQSERNLSEEEVSSKEVAELEKTLETALKSLIKMKETEGKALVLDLRKRLKTLSTNIAQIEKQSAKGPQEYEQKLKLRLKELCEEAEKDERVLREIALFSEKVDITEEVTRLKSHFQQMEELLQKKGESIGRTLDFLTQEMLREINTIAAKTSSLSATKKTIECKAELEKIREQVQNIE